jgi:hypothetical protein
LRGGRGGGGGGGGYRGEKIAFVACICFPGRYLHVFLYGINGAPIIIAIAIVTNIVIVEINIVNIVLVVFILPVPSLLPPPSCFLFSSSCLSLCPSQNRSGDNNGALLAGNWLGLRPWAFGVAGGKEGCRFFDPGPNVEGMWKDCGRILEGMWN